MELRDYVESYYRHWFHIEQIYVQWAQRHGIQANVLFALQSLYHAEEGQTQQEICKKLSMPKQTVSFFLQSLEREGLVCRREDPADRRRKLVLLTEAGRRETAPLVEEMEAAEQAAYGSLNEKQRRAVDQGLRLLAQALEKSFLEKTEK